MIEKLKQVLLEKETIYNEEFELLYEGKSVEEVEILIDQKEQEKKTIQEKARKEAETLKLERDKNSQLETAKALLRTGVINEKDFENIKSAIEHEKAMEEKQKQHDAKHENKHHSKDEDNNDNK